MKPSIVAPGANILSADGDYTSAGESYQSLSGTSMATPHMAGVCALLLQANPALTPLEVRTILQNTAEHDVVSEKGDRPNDPYSLDPNYDPGCGWGLVDVYAAAKEAMQSASGVQVVQIRATTRPDDEEVDVAWITQREFSFQGFLVHRAPDVNGAPGSFALISSLVPPAGHSNIQGVPNRTPYVWVDSDPGLQVGETYWYRVDWVDNSSVAHPEPPVPVGLGQEPAFATARFTIVHNEPDHELTITLGVSHGHDEQNPVFDALGFPSGEAESVTVLEPANAATATIGYLEHVWTYSMGASDGIAPNLPPSHTWPWFLKVDEAGYVNRSGRITAFSLFVHDSPGSETGTLYTTDSPLPAFTIETLATVVWIPNFAVSVPTLDAEGATRLAAWPNPFVDRLTVRSAVGNDAGTKNVRVTLGLYDVGGRLVRVLEQGAHRAGEVETIWDGRASQGHAVPPGVYFLRLDTGESSQSVKVVRVR